MNISLKHGKRLLFAGLVATLMSTSLTHAVALPLNVAGTDVTDFAYVGKSASTTTLTPTSGTNSLFGNVLEGASFNTSFNKITLTNSNNDTAWQKLRGDTTVDFAAVDVPISVIHHTSYMSSPTIISAGHQRPVQIPTIASSVAIIFNNPDIPVDRIPNLSSVQLARIFSGQYTNWNQLGLNLPSRNITVIAQNSDSGNTFGLVNHLNAIGGLPTGKFFSVKPKFEDAVETAKTSVFSFVDAYSDINAVSKLSTISGAISYVSSPLAYRYMENGVNFVRIATIQGMHPVNDLPVQISVASSDILTDQLMQGTLNAWNGTQAGKIVYTPINNQPEEALETVVTIRPESYARPAFGYPIINISYFVGHLAGNKQPVSKLIYLLRSPIIPSFRFDTPPALLYVDTIPNKGYAWLNGTAPAINKAVFKMQ